MEKLQKNWEYMYSCKKWNDISIRYNQENNIIELFLSKLKQAGQSTFRLESCGVESIGCAIEAVDGRFKFNLPKINGKAFMGYGDFLFDLLNSNHSDIPIKSRDIPNNEFIENLAWGAEQISFVKTNIHYLSFQQDIIPEMIAALKRQSAIVFSYLTDYGTGHFSTIVAYDDIKKVFIIYDPWSGNKHCKRNGVKEEFSEKFIMERSRRRFLEIYDK